VRVQVRGAQGRIHWEGFALSPSVMPEEIDAACPIGTVQVTGYCIQPETTAAFGQTWTAAQDHCVAAGLRLCGVGEINTAIRYGALRTYNISTERNAWYISADLAEDSPGAAGHNQNCQPQGNTNESGHPLYAVQCQHPMQDTAAYRTTICCW
jgi:hypothetical protein